MIKSLQDFYYVDVEILLQHIYIKNKYKAYLSPIFLLKKKKPIKLLLIFEYNK